MYIELFWLRAYIIEALIVKLNDIVTKEANSTLYSHGPRLIIKKMVPVLTKSKSTPPNHSFLVGAVTGRWFTIRVFLKGVVVGR